MKLFDYLHSILPALPHLGAGWYWIMLLVALAESLAVVGILVPGTVLVIVAGFLASQGTFDAGDLIWFVAAGAVLGDSLSFYLGRRGTGWFSAENKLLKLSHLERGQKFFGAHGGKSVFLGRFVGPLRPIIPFVAGVSRMPWRSFLLWSILSAGLWSAIYVSLGYFFGATWTTLALWSTRLYYAAAAFVLATVCLYALYWFIARYGQSLAAIIRSLWVSLKAAWLANPEVKKLAARYPRFAAFVKARADRQKLSGLPLTVAGGIFIYLALLFSGVVEAVLREQQLAEVDQRLAALFQAFRHPALSKVFLWITVLGSAKVVLVIGVAAAALWWLWGRRWYSVLLGLSLAGYALLVPLTKLLLHRPRPAAALYAESSFSFPSGHAMAAVVLFGFLAYALIRETRSWRQKIIWFLVALIISLAIGLSRLYLGVHYLSDVWAGYLLGLLWLVVVISLNERRRVRRATAPPPPRPRIKISALAITILLLALALVFYVRSAARFHPALAEPLPPPSPVPVAADAVLAPFRAEQLPRYTETLLAQPEEPLSFIIIAPSDAALLALFQAAGWQAADEVTTASLAALARAAFVNQPYPAAPITPSFWNGAVNDFAFEKPTPAATVRERHHARVWKTPLAAEGRAVYVGVASLDSGLKWLITHRIKPDIDTERDFLVADLKATGRVAAAKEEPLVSPVLGKNFFGDQFFTDGKVVVLIVP